MSAQFFGRSGKVLYGAFSIVGMASQPHNVNKGIPDDRVARSTNALVLNIRNIMTDAFKSCTFASKYMIPSHLFGNVKGRHW